MNLESVGGLIWNIAGARVKRICNLKQGKGFMYKIEGLALIYKKNSKIKGLSGNFPKELGLRLGF
jgi:hypothetical protein